MSARDQELGIVPAFQAAGRFYRLAISDIDVAHVIRLADQVQVCSTSAGPIIPAASDFDL